MKHGYLLHHGKILILNASRLNSLRFGIRFGAEQSRSRSLCVLKMIKRKEIDRVKHKDSGKAYHT